MASHQHCCCLCEYLVLLRKALAPEMLGMIIADCLMEITLPRRLCFTWLITFILSDTGERSGKAVEVTCQHHATAAFSLPPCHIHAPGFAIREAESCRSEWRSRCQLAAFAMPGMDSTSAPASSGDCGSLIGWQHALHANQGMRSDLTFTILVKARPGI